MKDIISKLNESKNKKVTLKTHYGNNQTYDILGLDDSARMNVPGTSSKNNWSWKLIDFEDLKERIKDFNI